jgi:hypothetical protein
MLLGYISLHLFGYLAFLIYYSAMKSLDGLRDGPIFATVRIVVVVKRGETFPSSPFVFRGMGWGDLSLAFRD